MKKLLLLISLIILFGCNETGDYGPEKLVYDIQIFSELGTDTIHHETKLGMRSKVSLFNEDLYIGGKVVATHVRDYRILSSQVVKIK